MVPLVARDPLFPPMLQVSGNSAAAVFFWFAGPLFWPYFLLQCGVGYFRVYAMVNGLIGSKKSKGWKVRASRAHWTQIEHASDAGTLLIGPCKIESVGVAF